MNSKSTQRGYFQSYRLANLRFPYMYKFRSLKIMMTIIIIVIIISDFTLRSRGLSHQTPALSQLTLGNGGGGIQRRIEKLFSFSSWFLLF